jgi:hypothetical protein
MSHESHRFPEAASFQSVSDSDLATIEGGNLLVAVVAGAALGAYLGAKFIQGYAQAQK